MSEIVKNSSALPVAVVIGATSKWQADGRKTRLVHGGEAVRDHEVALSARWGAGRRIFKAEKAVATVWVFRGGYLKLLRPVPCLGAADHSSMLSTTPL